MNIGISLFSGRQPIDAAVVRRRRKCWGLIPSGWESTRSCPCTAPPAPGSSGAASLISIVDSWTPSWPWPGLAVTTRLKLGTGITLVPERNPLLLAKEVATLDYFSKGRFVFGIGAGWNKEETELMGGNFVHRWTQTRGGH